MKLMGFKPRQCDPDAGYDYERMKASERAAVRVEMHAAVRDDAAERIERIGWMRASCVLCDAKDVPVDSEGVCFPCFEEAMFAPDSKVLP